MSSAQKIDLCLHGLSGYAKSDLTGWAFYGKWASHTGYRYESIPAKPEEVAMIAESLYTRQQPLCYLVGDEHRDMGWKTHQVNRQGVVQIRLPHWADEAIIRALNQVGVQLSDKLNHYWVFEPQVTLAQAREVLAPLLAASTRFADEEQLAGELMISYQRSAVSFEQQQMRLF